MSGENESNNEEKIRTVGDRLKIVRKKYSLERAEFAEKMGVTYSQQQTYENNRTQPGNEYWAKFEEVTSAADLLFVITGGNAIPMQEEKWIRVPIVGEINASRLTQGFRDEDVIDWVWTVRTKDKDVFGLKVHGNSMFPQIHDGDYVLCAPHRHFVSGKMYAVVARDSEHTVKTVYKEKEGYRLIPTNPEYDTDLILENEVIKLVRVVQVVSRYDEL